MALYGRLTATDVRYTARIKARIELTRLHVLSLCGLLLLGCGKNPPVSDIELPRAMHAAEFAVPEEGPTPIVKILADGTVFVDGEEMRRPGGGYRTVAMTLLVRANEMPRVPLWYDDLEPLRDAGPMIQANPIVIRADRAAPYHVIKAVLEICGHETIKIWKVRVVALGSETSELGTLPFEMMRDIGVSCPAPPISDVLILERSGKELVFWKRSGPAVDSPPPPNEFHTHDPAELQTHLKSFGVEHWSDLWRFYAPDDALWGDVVVALDCFVGAERRALLPMDGRPIFER